MCRLRLVRFKFRSSEPLSYSSALTNNTLKSRSRPYTIATQSRTWLVETKAFCANLLIPPPYSNGSLPGPALTYFFAGSLKSQSRVYAD